LHDFAEVTVETFFADVLVIKRRQHQHTGAAVFHRKCRYRDRFDNRAATGARHHAQWIEAGRHERIQQGDALVWGHRVRFAGRAKRSEPAILRKQPSAMPDEPILVRRKIGLERRDDRREHTTDALAWRQNFGIWHGCIL
jgi:hypothetical protein